MASGRDGDDRPPLSAEHGPVYFSANVIPDPTLTQTTEDGGVVFTNVPEGEYDSTRPRRASSSTPHT